MRSERILIIDDELIVSSGLAEMLGKLGFVYVDCANNARIASDFLVANCYDAVLMDINLGQGPDGIDIIKELKKKKDVPVIYLTGFADSRTLEKARGTFPAAFVTKPIS